MSNEATMYFKGMGVGFKQGKANSLLLEIAKKKLQSIIEECETDVSKEEKDLLQLMDYNVWNIYEANNSERQMTVEFEKYLQTASEIQGGIDVGNYTAFQFLCMNEKLQEKKNK